ncbi:endocuticle structural glycoprotein ABD-5-like [Chrysoperla carnea]|uniref:endocuticle structural glycoprotein ABD-5-like n=1 Tax=Chrysoperla carnea TaxID=189513 RepID=UPI001D088308|nr:endocuticle structural glycoprotein ABD-5-like [Chrysoperla carnea]
MIEKVMVSIIMLTAVFARPQNSTPQNSREATILRYENENIGKSGYNFAYETSDGTSRLETAEVVNPGTENETLLIRGTVTWIAPDGQQYTITYTADKDGYQPKGSHIPQ